MDRQDRPKDLLGHCREGWVLGLDDRGVDKVPLGLVRESACNDLGHRGGGGLGRGNVSGDLVEGGLVDDRAQERTKV